MRISILILIFQLTRLQQRNQPAHGPACELISNIFLPLILILKKLPACMMLVQFHPDYLFQGLCLRTRLRRGLSRFLWYHSFFQWIMLKDSFHFCPCLLLPLQARISAHNSRRQHLCNSAALALPMFAAILL